MPCPVTAFSVKIAACEETAALVREVLYHWNADRSWAEKKVFVPLAAESGAPDLLFVVSPQAPAESSEIDRQLKSGRPAVIYFSEARTDLQAADARLFEEFKKQYPADAVGSFKDEKELRSKFAQQLEALVRYHPHFRTEGEICPTSPLPESPPDYSKSAQALLIQACDDPEVYLARRKDARGISIQVNGRQFIEPGNAESAAQWDGAFGELLAAGLIRDAGCNGQLFQISAKGFEFLETLGKHPIGYIAELGGM